MATPWFGGARTLSEQMLGLEAALTEAPGKSVLDLGCAEGLIALEFVKAGASRALGIECNLETVRAAFERCGDRVHLVHGNLNSIPLPEGPWDIVLALAILHKLKSAAKMISDIAATGAGLVIVRLPGGSHRHIMSKHWGTPCDVNAEFVANGYELSVSVPGPRDELVQYWRRG